MFQGLPTYAPRESWDAHAFPVGVTVFPTVPLLLLQTLLVSEKIGASVPSLGTEHATWLSSVVSLLAVKVQVRL
jgi:hypothetical protein